MPYGLGASGPVTTAMTPSSCSARLVSMRRMRAWGCGECRILPTSMPGRTRSSVYLPAPVVLAAASTMGMARPMMEKLLISDGPGETDARLSEARECLWFSDDDHFAAAIPFCSASIAALMAWYICVYPVQRHRLLL